jgi:hypothetical protein
VTTREKFLAAFAALAILSLGYFEFSVLAQTESMRAQTDYERNFDRSLSGNALAASIARRDPGLREIFLHQTEPAFNKGGWRAANAALDMSLAANVLVYADDEHIVAVRRAYLVVFEKLKDAPAACKAFALAGSRKDEFPDARQEIDALVAAEHAAEENGIDRRLHGVKWIRPSQEQVLTIWQSITMDPDPMSTAEIEATAKYTEADAQAYCSGSIKFTRNLLAREIGAAAYAERILKSGIKIDWIAVMGKLCDGDKSNG